MYQPSRHLSTFFIAGFQHYDGALVINQMSIGDSIELCPEPGIPTTQNQSPCTSTAS